MCVCFSDNPTDHLLVIQSADHDRAAAAQQQFSHAGRGQAEPPVNAVKSLKFLMGF